MTELENVLQQRNIKPTAMRLLVAEKLIEATICHQS
jgi:Fur family ferric uptake transcriptional regulator